MQATSNVISGFSGAGRLKESRPAAAVIGAITALGGYIAYAWRMQGDRDRLRAMSDHLLADIGLTRDDIDSVTSLRRKNPRRLQD